MSVATRSVTTILSLVLPPLVVVGCPQFESGPSSGTGTAKGLVKVGQEQIYVRDQGEGPAVLLIHGYCGSSNHWARIQPELAKTHRVLAVDLPGNGLSDKRAGDYSMDAIAERLVGVLDAKRIRTAHVVAHSWGTSIALALALRAPARVSSLTLIGVWAYEEQLPPFIVWARAPLVGEVLYTLFFDERLDDRMGMTFYNVDAYVDPDGIEKAEEAIARPGFLAAALASARGMRFADLERRYKALPHRVLIIHGQFDPVTRAPWAMRLNSELKDSRLVVIPLAKHMAIYTQPQKVLRALRPFLAGLEPWQAVVAERPVASPPRPAPAPAPAPPPTPASKPADDDLDLPMPPLPEKEQP
jgi:pimeloyl-ACP methyl ester carboxylesterase